MCHSTTSSESDFSTNFILGYQLSILQHWHRPSDDEDEFSYFLHSCIPNFIPLRLQLCSTASLADPRPSPLLLDPNCIHFHTHTTTLSESPLTLPWPLPSQGTFNLFVQSELSSPKMFRSTSLTQTTLTATMSNAMDSFLMSNIYRAVEAQKHSVECYQARIDTAIQRVYTACTDFYTAISVFSIHWCSDDTGGDEDCSLFIQTIELLQSTGIKSKKREISAEDWDVPLLSEITTFAQPEDSEHACDTDTTRHLFILHYAGHARGDSTSDNLHITPRIGQGHGEGPEINMTFVKDGLKTMCSRTPGMDVLMVMDCCCAAIAGRGMIKGARVELMAATSPNGLSNSRQDGSTFTQHWCTAFKILLSKSISFTCTDIIGLINSRPDLETFPRTFILREGWEIPITFRSATDASATPTLPYEMKTKTVITAFHLAEDLDDELMKRFILFLERSPIPITIIAALPVGSTLIVLQIPAFFQELLGLPRIGFIMAA